jgi:cupin fold WbuC family metalloprotein
MSTIIPSRIISDELIDQLLPMAASNPRGRINYNIHSDYSEAVQRFVNVITYASYVRPHHHNQENNWEGIIILRGELSVFQFDNDGRILERIELSENGPVFAIELDATAPHCITALSEFAVIFEYKQGPYIIEEDKTFQQWAPAEQDEQASLFNQWLKTAGEGEQYRSGTGDGFGKVK